MNHGNDVESDVKNHDDMISEDQAVLKETENQTRDMISFYKEISDYLNSKSLPEPYTEVQKKILKKKSQNYKVSMAEYIFFYGNH